MAGLPDQEGKRKTPLLKVKFEGLGNSMSSFPSHGRHSADVIHTCDE